jgi:hypothetical protein
MVVENLLKSWGTIGEEGPLNRSPKIQPLQPKCIQKRYYRRYNRYYQVNTASDSVHSRPLSGSKLVVDRYYRLTEKL